MTKIDGQTYILKNAPDEFYDQMYQRLDWLGQIFFEGHLYTGVCVLDSFTIDDLMQRVSFQSPGLHRSIELRFNGISRDHVIDTKKEYEMLEEVLSDIYLERARELVERFNREETWQRADEGFARDIMGLFDVYRSHSNGSAYSNDDIKELEQIISGIDLAHLRKQEVLDLWKDVKGAKYEYQKTPFITGFLEEIHHLRSSLNIEVVNFKDWEKAVVALFETHPEAVDFEFFITIMNDMQFVKRRLIEDYILQGKIPEDVEENLYFDPEAGRTNIVDLMFEKYPEKMLFTPWNGGDQRTPPMMVLLERGHPKALQIFMDFLKNDEESPYVQLLADFVMGRLSWPEGEDYYGDFLRDLMDEKKEFKDVHRELMDEFDGFRAEAQRVVREHFYTDAPFSGVIATVFTNDDKALDLYGEMVAGWKEDDRAAGVDFKPPTYANIVSLIGSEFLEPKNYGHVTHPLMNLMRRGYEEALDRLFDLTARSDAVAVAAVVNLAEILKYHFSMQAKFKHLTSPLSEDQKKELKEESLTPVIFERLVDYFKNRFNPYSGQWNEEKNMRGISRPLVHLLASSDKIEFENTFQFFVKNMGNVDKGLWRDTTEAFAALDNKGLYGDRPLKYLIELAIMDPRTRSETNWIEERAYDAIKRFFKDSINITEADASQPVRDPFLKFKRYAEAMFVIAEQSTNSAIEATEALTATYGDGDGMRDDMYSWLGVSLRNMGISMLTSYLRSNDAENYSKSLDLLSRLAKVGNRSAFEALLRAFEDGLYAGEILDSVARVLFDDDKVHLHGEAEDILFAAIDKDLGEAWGMLEDLATANIGVDYKYATRLISARSAGNYDAQRSAALDFDKSLSDYIYSLDIEYDSVDRERGLIGRLAGSFESWEAWHALEWFTDEQKMLYESKAQAGAGPNSADADREDDIGDAGGSRSGVIHVEKADGGMTEAYKVYHQADMNGYYDAAIDDSQPPEVRRAGIDRITDSAQSNTVAALMLSGIAGEFGIDMAISNYALRALVLLAMQDDPPIDGAKEELSILIGDFERIAIDPQGHINIAKMAVLNLYKIVVISNGECEEAIEALENIVWSLSPVRLDAGEYLELIKFHFPA